MSILVIVESAGKISKISKILGKNYIVKACMGHFRDLDPLKMSIDFDNNFEPIYIITKPPVVKNLKSVMKNVDMVYLAADGDREGAQIAQSLYHVLKPKKYKRLRFNEVTKKAIMAAIKNAGEIETDLVNAQKARRVLDRLFGYMISPILQKQLGGKLSAGRVQSVAAKIVIDKENEIIDFIEKNKDSTFFKVNGLLSKFKSVLYESSDKKPYAFKPKDEFKGKIAKMPLIDKKNTNVTAFLKLCLKSDFLVHSITDRIASRSPAPPFETCTLQQEANRKFGMSIDITMRTAQKLYEGGYITYMRTDSVELSEEAHDEIKKVIIDEYGKDYYQKNVYKSKSESSQMAHEAIRPTHADLFSLEKEIDDPYQIKLYKLIWQRTIASQMKPAKIKVITIQISISKYIENKLEPFYYFQSQIENILFHGFMKVYVESTDDPLDDHTIKDFNGSLPKIGEKLNMDEIIAKQEYLRPPPRYSEASLVKYLKKMDIGRPSTYVNTIKTIIDRKYVKIDNVAGIEKKITTYSIKSENKKRIMSIDEDNGTVLLGKESKKIIPTNLGISVNDFLVENFSEMIDYKFTAGMEKDLDKISNGEKIWHKVVQKFYDKLKPIVVELDKKKGVARESEKIIGVDDDGIEIYAIKTRDGPAIRKKMGKKFAYANIEKPLTIETIKLKDAIKLFEYPKLLGKYEKADVYLKKGPHGLYICCGNENFSFNETDETKIDRTKISLKQAIEIIKTKKSNNLAEFNITEKGKKFKALVLNGKYGPYIQVKNGKKTINYRISRNIDAQKLTDKKVLEIISAKKSAPKKVYTGSKTNKRKTYTAK